MLYNIFLFRCIFKYAFRIYLELWMHISPIQLTRWYTNVLSVLLMDKMHRDLVLYDRRIDGDIVPLVQNVCTHWMSKVVNEICAPQKHALWVFVWQTLLVRINKFIKTMLFGNISNILFDGFVKLVVDIAVHSTTAKVLHTNNAQLWSHLKWVDYV